ncbi:MAG: DUF1178 family protein [Magnetospirillum sp. WYHS-4]
MIHYQLKCDSGHEFEAWFRDGATYEAQAVAGDVACPYCGDTHVAKAPMAPNIATGTQRREMAEDRARQVADQILKAVDRLRKHVEQDCEYVGERFAEEARRIHYGESEERGIFGEGSEEDAADLREEGVEFYRLPSGIRKNG